MKVAIVHYHLQPGGVTRVIENTILAWTLSGADIDTVTLSGRPYDGSLLGKTEVVEGLDYANSENAINPDILTKRMEESASKALGQIPDIWHIHNHSLGKNSSLTAAVALLAQKGQSLLLHPHDFAEDGRPDNFLSLKTVYNRAYPTSGRIHYAVLNQRDYLFFDELLEGSSSKVHLLANAIPSDIPKVEVSSQRGSLPENLYLYPVRAVRRKNLGELALLSMIHPDKHFANSLGPTNPAFRPQFEEWNDFSKNHNLSVTFGLGETGTFSFPEMVMHSEAIITTSIAEGFGLGFLEPWIFGKGLCGRNIPEVTQDFSKLGISLDHLYERIEVDLELIGKEENFISLINQSLRQFYSDYGEIQPVNSSQLAIESMVKNGYIDFGRLNESMQKEVLNKIKTSSIVRTELREQITLDLPNKERFKKNKESIVENFSLKSYGTRLQNIYKQVLENKETGLDFANGRKLLSSFLCPSRLNLLRTR